MKQLKLSAIDQVSGTIRLPGSKSISNRALLMAALSTGNTRISNLLFSDDVNYMLDALRSLGVDIHVDQNERAVIIKGLGHAFRCDNPTEIYLGNAGTAMRPLCAVLAMSDGEFVLTGEERMKERPIAHLVDALKALGAQVTYDEAPGYPPITIEGKKLQQDQVSIDGSLSSQYITALLIAAPLMPNGLMINIEGELVSKPYIDITIAMMERFGIQVDGLGNQRYFIKGSQQYTSPGEYIVEGDASSASYFLAAAAINGGTVEVQGVGSDSLQGDKYFADVLSQMGAEVEWGKHFIRCTKGKLKGIDMDMNHIPDAAMTIATTALFAEGPTCIRNVYNWRIKETDRLSAMTTELKKLGATVEEGHDYLKIWPLDHPKLAEIGTYNDHRMAMCFSMVAVAGHDVVINDPDCVAKTFPDYFEALTQVSHYSK